LDYRSIKLQALLVSASLLFLVAWAFAVPIFEAPDEPHHWMNARYIHDRWRLPPYNKWFAEGGQAPLYYLLVAPFAAKSDFPSDARDVDPQGRIESYCPPRFYQNCIRDFARFWPIRTVRLLTVLFSVLAVWFAFLAAAEVTGSIWTGLLAGGLMAFLPEFTFRGMNVSNDAMVALTSAAGTYGIVRLLRRGFAWPAAWAAALAAALAFLSKLNGLAIAIVLAAVIVLMSAPWRVRLQRLAVVPAAFVIALPWLIHNQVLYGDALASKAMATLLPHIVERKSITDPYFIKIFPVAVERSFVAVFGWMNLLAPTALYWTFAGVGIVAGVGLLWRLVRCRKHTGAVIAALAGIVMLSIALLVQLNLTFSQPQGRLLFPALPAVAVLTALGLEALPFWNLRLTCATVLAAAALNVFVLAMVIVPAYWVPNPHENVAVDVSVSDKLVTAGQAGPLNPGTTYGQTFTATENNLSIVDVLIATYNHQPSKGVLKMRLRKSPKEHWDIAAVAVRARSINDCTYVRLAFPPIADSAHRSYYLELETEDLAKEEHLTVFLSGQDVYGGGNFWVNRLPRIAQDTCFRTFYTRGLCPSCTPAVPEDVVFQKKP
jgi:Dolichyl-phosphate-mannose-protein mannosyltransferase